MMRRARNLLLFVGLVLTEALQATASEGEPALDLEPAEPHVVMVDVADAAIPAAVVSPSDLSPPDPDGSVDLSHVVWTVDADQPIDTLSSKWGLRVSELVALNPELAQVHRVWAGQRLVVFRERADAPTASLGRPNRGRLAHGIPLPEGEPWQLRTMRRRAFGTSTTIASLVTAFNAYAREFSDAPPIRVGEISGPRGGRANPHKSHRSGRDVDIGFVLKNPPAAGWRRATPHDFDVEKNWALIRALVDTGHVHQIYVSAGLQKLLRKHAAKELSREELAVYFWDEGLGPQQRPVLKHQNGHRDHMHVRFRCEPGNARCRG